MKARRICLALVGSTVLVLAGCGSSTKAASPPPTITTSTALPPITTTALPPTTTTAPPSIPTAQIGNYQTVITAADLNSGPHDSEDVPGTWAFSLDRDGLFTVSINGRDVLHSLTQMTSDHITIRPDNRQICTDAGTYSYADSGSTTSFHVVSDPCLVRAFLLTRHPWTFSA
jgi:hypothetical protein